MSLARGAVLPASEFSFSFFLFLLFVRFARPFRFSTARSHSALPHSTDEWMNAAARVTGAEDGVSLLEIFFRRFWSNKGNEVARICFYITKAAHLEEDS